MGLFDKQQKKVVSPIEFSDKKDSPISFIEKDINTERGFAITRLTENGRYMRGNLLFYSLNGVEVYTDPDNIIFVDTINNTLFIRENQKVSNNLAPEDPEKRQYILLYTDLGYDENSDSEFPLRWESVIGRTNTYENIKANVSVIDIEKSIVLVETVTVKDALSVQDFVKYLKNANLVEKDGFEIDDYLSEYM